MADGKIMALVGFFLPYDSEMVISSLQIKHRRKRETVRREGMMLLRDKV